MIAYCGDTTSKVLMERLRAAGIGQMLSRGRLNRLRPGHWAFDNGAFEDWRNKRPFDAEQFNGDLARIVALPPDQHPDFIVLPDKVAQGPASLDFSLEWLRDLRDRGVQLRCYLAVQDGMQPGATAMRLDGVDGVFVGGTLKWKLQTGQDWVHVAHGLGLPCHVGRVGSYKRVAWAKLIGADSIDSCLPLWSRHKEKVFIRALNQGVLFAAGEPAKREKTVS